MVYIKGLVLFFIPMFFMFGASTNLALLELKINNVFMVFSAILVFIMHLGFATLETGLTRAKNSINILFKNLSIVAIATISYAFIGFNLMYPGEFNGYIGFSHFGLKPDLSLSYNQGYTYWTDFLFQAMFAAATASIISGAVCERIKLSSFLIYAIMVSALIYPILGSWHWGGGWLSELGFHDLAGSTVVHSVGGWAALVGAFFVGPRRGRFQDGKIRAIPGHNIPLATIGAFLLWFGWFGFNGGSQLDANPLGISHIMVMTLLASCAGILTSTIASRLLQGRIDITMVLNGCLAGLVAITAGADCISPLGSVITGAVAGVIVVFSVVYIDRLKIDDPVGAISVHLINGIWGTIAVGIFGAEKSLLTQIIGIVAYGITCLILSTIVILVIKKLIGLNINEEEESKGLDAVEHGMTSYPYFEKFSE